MAKQRATTTKARKTTKKAGAKRTSSSTSKRAAKRADQEAPAAAQPPAVEDPTAPLDPVDAVVHELIKRGKGRGWLTWEELNETLPDAAMSPDRLEGILTQIEDNKIEMIDEAEADKVAFAEDEESKTSLRDEEGMEEINLEEELAEASSR
ncbi:MAG: hypothetical protein JXQ73_19250, partial [Phycisphaerae bacterium]|nr:hypothetical protein [Phycisphaerae bacterium]